MSSTQQQTVAGEEEQQQSQRAWYTRGSIPLGSCGMGGLSIYLHYTFFALVALMVLSAIIQRTSDPAYWGIIALVYGPILLHELSHAWMTKRLGGEVGDLVLWPLGGFVVCGPTETIAGDFKVAIAGPISHIPQMIFWAGIFAAAEGGDFQHFTRFADLRDINFLAVLCAQSFYLNVILFVFNLFIPAYPLDGGRCFAAALVMCGLNVLTSAIVTAVTGMIIAAAIAVWGIVDFIRGNPGGIFLVAIGAWIFLSSYQLFKLTRPASGMYGTPVEHLKSHPVFGRECYQRTDRERRNNSEPNGSV